MEQITVVCIDVSAPRIQLCKELRSRVGGTWKAVCCDGTTFDVSTLGTLLVHVDNELFGKIGWVCIPVSWLGWGG